MSSIHSWVCFLLADVVYCITNTKTFHRPARPFTTKLFGQEPRDLSPFLFRIILWVLRSKRFALKMILIS